MIGKLRLAPIEPDGAYIIGSTGPRMGASLFFSGSRQAPLGAAALDIRVRELAMELGLGMRSWKMPCAIGKRVHLAFARFVAERLKSLGAPRPFESGFERVHLVSTCSANMLQLSNDNPRRYTDKLCKVWISWRSIGKSCKRF